MYPYPENVGVKIPLSSAETNALDTLLSKRVDLSNLIITVFGLPSTGKSTLSSLLSEKLGLPLFDTGILYRTYTYFFLKSGRNMSDLGLADFLTRVDLSVEDKKVCVYLNGLRLDVADIRTPEIDKEIGKHNKIPEVRELVNKLIADFVRSSSFVTNGRGANDGYLLEAEGNKVRVIRVLLQAEQKERVRRRFIDYLNLSRHTDLELATVCNLWKTCEEVVRLRDEEEILKEKTLNLGLVTGETGVLDTTDLEINQAVLAVHAWVLSQLL